MLCERSHLAPYPICELSGIGQYICVQVLPGPLSPYCLHLHSEPADPRSNLQSLRSTSRTMVSVLCKQGVDGSIPFVPTIQLRVLEVAWPMNVRSHCTDPARAK